MGALELGWLLLQTLIVLLALYGAVHLARRMYQQWQQAGRLLSEDEVQLAIGPPCPHCNQPLPGRRWQQAEQESNPLRVPVG